MSNKVGLKRRRDNTDNDEDYRSTNSRNLNQSNNSTHDCTIGKVKRIFMRNFMCHDAMEVILNENVNFIVGQNGSGKSAILTALTIGLGGRATLTNRGASVKAFIKKGKNAATIEITLFNKGPMAYKPDIYGDFITVTRFIGSTTVYKIKNWKGEIISTKREELNRILSTMNIQIDNPISILNQDISRTFLVSSKPEEKYELFMRATHLDVIGKNYKEAEISCEETDQRLKHVNETLSKIKKEISKLKENLKKLEKISMSRKELDNLEAEIHWATVILEEKRLQQCEENLKICQEKIEQFQQSTTSMESKNKEINEKIQKLQEEVQKAEHEVTDSTDRYNTVKQQSSLKRKAHSVKVREWQLIQSKIKRLDDDMTLLRKEIQRLESGENGEQNERVQLKQRLAELEQRLDEVEAMLRTKQTDQMHLEADKMRRLQEINSIKIEIDSSGSRIRKIKQELSALKQQSDNALTVFGSNIPRLLKRIEEECRRGSFKQEPRGPIGAYMKMKDPSWVPAVESFLGGGSLSAFCVDNTYDAKILVKLMEEVFLHDRSPQIISSKFYNRVHNVSQHCTRSPNYSNLLDAMDISDPIVANCLIDQREIECVLLIPSSQEACYIMSDVHRVPRYCKQALTQQGDIFYPDPNYRSYGGKRGLRAKFLQVSTTEAIQRLEEELKVATEEGTEAAKKHNNIREETNRTQTELKSVSAKVMKLLSSQNELKQVINGLVDKIESSETISVTVFRNELTELEKKLEHEKTEEQRLEQEVTQLQKSIDDLDSEIKHHRDMRHGLDVKVNPLKDEIRRLNDEKEMLNLQKHHATSALEKLQKTLQSSTAELEIQQRSTTVATANASKLFPRINTTRSVSEIKSIHKDLKTKIYEAEQYLGSKETLCNELKEKQLKYGDKIETAVQLEEINKNHLERLKIRKSIYQDMKKTIGIKIQNSFASVLALRKYTGFIKIDHVHKLLELEVSPRNDKKETTNSTKSLSGGERSYSTVAFILALWDCTGLPFYFLDEFDVFMDKVNRRVIMDILLDHTKSHPQCQYTFLTPLDTSNILAEDYVTIHQLAPPERTSQN